ncbi:MAG: glycosyltransferase, partial [Agathobacter sp.]
MNFDNVIILIPALDPSESMLILLAKLMKHGFRRIIITDDGSKAENQIYFKKAKEIGTVVVHHPKTMGKGTALKTALKTAEQSLGGADFYITADCDGQHTPEDIEKIASSLLANPDSFVIGARKFERTEGKKLSYWVNYFQRMFFRVTNHGKECPDPGSGLRGFPSSLKELALCTEGKSYDYELNFLDAASQATSTIVVPISAETLSKDETSHFRPVVDLLGMYLKFWRYLFTSNIATIFDLVLFAAFDVWFVRFGAVSIFVSTVCARVISGLVGYVLNRYISFRSHLQPGKEMAKYFIVFIGQMAVSGILVSVLSCIPIPTVLVKAMVDFGLFFVGYSLQKNWVFTPGMHM